MHSMKRPLIIIFGVVMMVGFFGCSFICHKTFAGLEGKCGKANAG